MSPSPTFLEADVLPLPAQEATGSWAILGVRLAWSVPPGHPPQFRRISDSGNVTNSGTVISSQGLGICEESREGSWGLQDDGRERNRDPAERGRGHKEQIKEGLESPAHFQEQVNTADGRTDAGKTHLGC